jgi:hypothetical protein
MQDSAHPDGSLVCPDCHERDVTGVDDRGRATCLKCFEEEAEYWRKVALVRPLAAEFMRRARELTEGDDLMIGTAIQETTDRLQIL